MHIKQREGSSSLVPSRSPAPIPDDGVRNGGKEHLQLNSALVHELEARLTHSTIVTPDSKKYTESIKRWSDAAEKKAVRLVDGKERSPSVLEADASVLGRRRVSYIG